ncbi:serine/threonine-protein kinase Nek7-like [Acropora palmata]|uniref:serine/threonine-protein kinase Nek7-like n=1 Tax=Acropora palmata TaxID=6131 RepID=UPI003DA133AD
MDTSISEDVVKTGDIGKANFDFSQFSLTQHTSFVSTRSASERNKVGTAPYTAPELIELGAERNFPGDVYSMGMVMIEFTLRERSHPWEGEVSSSDLIFHHVQQGRRPTIIPNMLNGLDDNVKEDWLSKINRCLDQEPEKRPPIATVT